jgi:hypothetical protein
MKKYISLLMLPIFLGSIWFFGQRTTEHAFADVPLEQCPAGSMRLDFGDGSTTGTSATNQPADPWSPAPAPNPAPNPNPAPVIDWDSYLDDEIIERYNRNPRFRNANEQVVQNAPLVTKAFAQWDAEGGDEGFNGGQVSTLGGGPTCANYSQFRNTNNVAHLACIVMQEQGGGPFCLRQRDNAIFNGLMDNSCRQHTGTQLAGFRIVATFPTYACGVASPVTDG